MNIYDEMGNKLYTIYLTKDEILLLDKMYHDWFNKPEVVPPLNAGKTFFHKKLPAMLKLFCLTFHFVCVILVLQ